jgi:UDP-2-acetamido-3-amino-2,3-dideoxy-glucuronate N-acetyltransferase
MSEMREHTGGYAVHESSYVDEGAQVGAGTRIWHFCHIMSGARIGPRCTLGQNVVVMSGTSLGTNVKVQNNVSIYEGVHCEDDVFLGPSMVFTNVLNPRSHVSRKTEYKRTDVRRGATIGANATVLCGHELGEYCLEPFALVAGVPARLIGWMCRCGVRLPFAASLHNEMRATCKACGTGYVAEGHRLRLVASAARV